MSKFFTYAIPVMAYLPDDVEEYDNIDDAILGFYGEIQTSCEYLDLPMPEDIPSDNEIINALENGSGFAYGYGEWVHVIGTD